MRESRFLNSDYYSKEGSEEMKKISEMTKAECEQLLAENCRAYDEWKAKNLKQMCIRDSLWIGESTAETRFNLRGVFAQMIEYLIERAELSALGAEAQGAHHSEPVEQRDRGAGEPLCAGE